MAGYVVRRLLRAAISLLIFQTVLFFLMQALPWDYASILRLPPEFRQAVREALGLDLPIGQQYAQWMHRFFSGDLGTSYVGRGVPVMVLFLRVLPRTLLLFLPGVVMGYALGLWLGKRIAWRRGGWVEWLGTTAAMGSAGSFVPWVAFVLVSVFAHGLGWLPAENVVDATRWAGSAVSSSEVCWWMVANFGAGCAVAAIGSGGRRARRRGGGFVHLVAFAVASVVIWHASGVGLYALDILRHLALPLVTLVLVSFGEPMMLMRAAMVSAMTDDHVLVARAKGLAPADIRDRHAARVAALPVLARGTLHLPMVFIGSFVVERVFFWQGMGETLFRAIDSYDVPVVMGFLSLAGMAVLVTHLLLDVLQAWLDPRLRSSAGRLL